MIEFAVQSELREVILLNKCVNVAGSTCRFKCRHEGWVWEEGSQSSISCLIDGSWSYPVPKCVPPLTCSPINPPANGLIRGKCSGSRVYETCSFRCIPGYLIRGSETLVCLPNGWDSVEPYCVSSPCTSLTAPASGRIYDVSCSPGIPDISVCNFSCDPGFKLIGKRQLRCLPTGWSSSIPFCQNVSCPPPPAIADGLVSCKLDITLTSEERVKSQNLSCQLPAGIWTEGRPDFEMCKWFIHNESKNKDRMRP